MKKTFKEAIDALVEERIKHGADPMEVFEELSREANTVFGRYNLEYELVEKRDRPGGGEVLRLASDPWEGGCGEPDQRRAV